MATADAPAQNAGSTLNTIAFDKREDAREQYRRARGRFSHENFVDCFKSEYDVAYDVLRNAYNAEMSEAHTEMASIHFMDNGGAARFRRGSREHLAALKLEQLGHCTTETSRRFTYVGITHQGADFWISDEPLPVRY